MRLRVKEIANILGATVIGDGDILISGVAGLGEATSKDLSFFKDPKKAAMLALFAKSMAGAVIVPKGVSLKGKTLLEVENPMVSFSTILKLIFDEINPAGDGKIDVLSRVSAKAKIGKNVTIGPFCTIEDDAEIGDNSTLISNVYVGKRARVGNDNRIYPHVAIREDVVIGDRCILHAGCIIGSDGYGFFYHQKKHNKIHQIGNVVICDDVEIGSCTTIDRATTGSTTVKTGTKIDNLVQIAHNVEIGEHSLLAAQVGIAGSAKLGKGVVFGGQAGVKDHLTIGDGTQVGGQSGVQENTPAGSILFGSPAIPVLENLKQVVLIRRLPQLYKEVKNLKDKQKI